MGRRKPNTTFAVVDIDTLEVKPPKVKEPSPLEVVVEQSFDSIIKAVTEKGYSLSDLCQVLRKRGIRPSPKTLKLAMIAYAEKNGKLENLPKPFHLAPRSGGEQGDEANSPDLAGVITVEADSDTDDDEDPPAEEDGEEGASKDFVGMPNSF